MRSLRLAVEFFALALATAGHWRRRERRIGTKFRSLQELQLGNRQHTERINGFNSALFDINTTDFANSYNGIFSFTQNGDDLFLS